MADRARVPDRQEIQNFTKDQRSTRAIELLFRKLQDVDGEGLQSQIDELRNLILQVAEQSGGGAGNQEIFCSPVMPNVTYPALWLKPVTTVSGCNIIRPYGNCVP